MRSIKFTLMMSVFVLVGCAAGTRTLENLQVPEFSNNKSSAGTVYIARISDTRVFEQKPRNPSTPSVKGDLKSLSREELSTLIGRQRDSYGLAMGDLKLPAGITVQDKVRALLVEGLESRGYKVVNHAGASNRVSVDINQFWAWFTPGFATVGFESKLQCKIRFEKSSNIKTFVVNGYGKHRGGVASNANWEIAYKKGFHDFLKNLDKSLDARGL